ncbi:MAG: hypothetical protein F6K22_13305 [Okeania sp. SIO2F4]|uniref:hypothetical protein n=1 Tax=Okeania sp. SIO2F4 TaxID=2607790 RepID=UPI001428DB14|nr:hypothetical protein [Okeania sp. SIO2F4]NES03733.1 hypothetical protein [Okeania sp. SIO2F4]
MDEVVGARDTVQTFGWNEMAAMMSCILSYDSTFSGPAEAYVPPCVIVDTLPSDLVDNSESFINQMSST